MAGGTLRASTPDLATLPQPVSWGDLSKGDQHHLLVPVRLRARGQHPYAGWLLPAPFWANNQLKRNWKQAIARWSIQIALM